MHTQLIFQTTVRCLAFAELADDPATVRRLKELYDTLDTATTPATVLLPWLPGPSAIRRLLATKRIYDIINGTLSERMEKGIVRDDTPQMLIDAGDEKLVIIGVSCAFTFTFALVGSCPFFLVLSSTFCCFFPAALLLCPLAASIRLLAFPCLRASGRTLRGCACSSRRVGDWTIG